MDRGLTSNYINAQECTARNLAVEDEESAEELTIADDSVVKTQGRVLVKFRCSGYQGRICTSVFAQK